jgi:Arc/MetJ family transcription regulator
MRTNIEVDDKLMREAMKIARTRTKRETVEEGLKLLVQIRKQERIRQFRGKLHWEGNLDEMRRD